MEALIRPDFCVDLSAPRAYAVPELAGQRLADERIVSSLPCLAEIHLIVGANYCRSAVNYRTIRCRSGLLAVSRRFGWLVFGREKRPGTPRAITLTTITESATPSNPETGNVNLRKFWEMEHFGIINPYEGVNEPNPLANFENLIQRNTEGRYSVPLLWRTTRKIYSLPIIIERMRGFVD